MSKRYLSYLSGLLLVILLTASCDAEIKMAKRGVYQGPATLTPFLPKATFTSVGSPALQAEPAEDLDSSSASSGELDDQAAITGTAQTEQGSTTPDVSASPGATQSGVTATLTSIPSTLSSQSDPSATPQPAAVTTQPSATTAPGNPLAPSSTSAPTSTSSQSNTPLPTNTLSPSNTPLPSNTSAPVGCAPSGNVNYESQVINLINQERESRGLSALTLNSSLRQAARGHSEDMACNDFFSHTGSDGSSLSSRIIAAGYSYSWAAENIAASSSCSFSASSVVNMWMNSAGHKANILSADAVHIGVGFRCLNDGISGDLDAYYTADFGKP